MINTSIFKRGLTAGVKFIIHLTGNVLIKPFLLAKRKRALKSIPQNPRILYVSLAFRGDLVLTFPAIRALRQRFPSSMITLWVREFNASLTDLTPDIDKIETYDKFDSHGLRVLGEFIPENIHLGFINKIRKAGYDIYVDDSGYTFTALIGSLSNIPLRIGRNQQGFGFLYHYDFPYDGDGQIIERKFRPLESLGISINTGDELRPRLVFPDNQLAKALAKANLSDYRQNYFAITPFTGWPAKNWDIDKYVFVVNEFGQYSKLMPVFLGGPNDIALIERIIDEIKIPGVNLVGKLSLAETAAIISKGKLHIGGDTFGSHVAAAAQIKCLSIFGPTNPSLSAYLTKDNIAVLKKIDCIPKSNKIYCFRDAGRSCPHVSCMRQLKKEDVLAVLKDLWDGKSSSKVIEF